MLHYKEKEVTILSNLNFFKMKNSVGLVFLFSLLLGSEIVFANVDDWIKEATTQLETCDKNFDASVKPGSAPGTSSSSGNTPARNRCVTQALSNLKNKKGSNCDKNCIKAIDDFISTTKANYEIPADQRNADNNTRCDNLYNENSDNVKVCSNINQKKAHACFESTKDEGFLPMDELQAAAPFLGSISGAEALIGIYTAQNDKPECRLSADDFDSKEDKLDEQKRDLEDKIKDNIKEAEEAQTDYASKLKEWSDQEGEMADRLAAIPGEKEENQDKLQSEKVKAKLQADSKYNAVVDQINELSRKYNDLVDSKSVQLAENSDFSIHDRCADESVAAKPSPNGSSQGQAQPQQMVRSTFAGAFSQGKTLTSNIQKRYDVCINRENKKQKRVENSFKSELNAIKAKIQSYENVLGQVKEEKRLADEEINKQIAKLATSADAEIKQLALKYQRLQSEKQREEALVKNKLSRLSSENKKYEEKLSIIKMKLNHYQNNRPPKSADGKSMAETMDQCGQNFKVFLDDFKENCCVGNDSYVGVGSRLCKMKYADFEAKPPSAAEVRAKKEAAKKATPPKKAGEIK